MQCPELGPELRLTACAAGLEIKMGADARGALWEIGLVDVGLLKSGMQMLPGGSVRMWMGYGAVLTPRHI